ncbi:hypothetical protein Y032_0098g3072 [Ancylostoma ceylanicum]|uniref:ZP domain-containing protein n=2 Tax=Ancylostoma ceylanicum TaxID=53326 RepID=A0A016TIB0_9BILA|nr:hypothetical protein Y032_0098g3072 [Ancylostoma ceylanicum]
MVDQMENRVYVQMEKDAQTAADRQFLFVCQLADAKNSKDRGDFAIRRHPVGPVVDSGAYVTPPGAGGHPFLMHNSIEPNTVPRVSAYSSDGHLGNWPIPGAHPYTPSDVPVASWPRQPLPDPIIPENHPARHGATFALSEGGGARIGEDYATAPTLRVVSATTPRNPFLPPPSSTSIGPIVPARDLPRPASELFDKQVAVARRPVEPVRNFFTVRAPIEVVRPTSVVPIIPAMPAATTTSPNAYVLPDAVVARNEIETVIGIDPRMAYKGRATEVCGLNSWIFYDLPLPLQIPAYPWNKPYPGSARTTHLETASGAGGDIVKTASIEIDKRVGYGVHDKAKVFKEELPRIGVEFRTDGGNKVAPVEAEEFPTSRLVSTQEYLAPPTEMSLEIQQGIGPFAPTVNSPVKIGDNITLVVRSKSQMKGEDAYDMFVHSCFASDGPGATRIDLIDKNGCVIRPQFVSPLNRTRDPSGTMYYFFRITAFKFPGPDDVYFSCSIEMTPFRNAPEICAQSRRFSREVSSKNDVRLFDSVKVELDEQYETQRRAAELNEEICLSKTLSGTVAVVFATLLVAFIGSSFLAMSFYLRLSDRTKHLYNT